MPWAHDDGRGRGRDVVGIASTPDGQGYWVVEAGGAVFSFGDAHPQGSTATGPGSPVVGIAS